MKTILPLLITILTVLQLQAQEITGQWNGVLKVQGVQLRLVFNVSESDSGLTSTMDSPDQGANGIPVTKTTFENQTITLAIPAAGIEYTGDLKDSEIVGTFKQAGQEFPMNLSREVAEKTVAKRPQEPKQPFPYYSEKVTFSNAEANVSLSGTLTLPTKEGIFPVVVLISGSGPQDRNGELMNHKPFLVIADFLTKNGMGVLRYDDRGVGQSTGEFKKSTSTDFAADVESAVAYLKQREDIDNDNIGLIGHSEGGLIAPMVASKSKDVAFIVLLAGTGIPGDQILLLQQKLIGRAVGISEEQLKKNEVVNKKVFGLVNKAKNQEQLRADLTMLIKKTLKESSEKIEGMTDEEYTKLQVDLITDPWMRYFIKYDPAPKLEEVKCPVLAINGEKDLQVPPKENLEAIEKALLKGGNEKVTIKQLPNLNHLFQECETGSPDEYEEIEQTFSPKALEEILVWMQSQIE